MIKTLAIQGVKGSYHHMVSQQYFSDKVAIMECLNFDEVVQAIVNKSCDAAIMALENSIAGSIIPNYALLDTYNLQIVGEYYLKIQHHLMALTEQSILDIKEVYSHPMALLQCKAFFKQYPHIKLIEDSDTAAVAKRIRNQNLLGVAAIASSMAATLYGLEILASNIQTITNNETRFVIVQRNDTDVCLSEISKASIKLEINHKRGSLAAILQAMSNCNLNLTKIQSLPIIETPWKYAFFIDVTFNSYLDFKKAKPMINNLSQNFKVLGVYKNMKL